MNATKKRGFMTHPVITISRQYGSGGRLIGEAVAKELGIAYYNRELIDMAAEASGLGNDYIKAKDEKLPNGTLFGAASFGGAFSPFTPYVPYSNVDKMFFTQSDIIRKVAAEGPCVIIGRCSNYVLKDYPGTLSIFVHARRKSRVARIIRRYGIEPDTAYSEMTKVDKHRANYYSYYTDCKWGEVRGYHMTMDSAFFSIEGAARVIVDIYRNFLLGRE